MIFDHIIGLEKLKDSKKLIYRVAIRAIIVKDNQLLMIANNMGDVKFPGGGLELNESHEAAVQREVKEETGYVISNVENLIGKVIERRQDMFDKDCIFQMDSFYYSCKIKDEKTEQTLDDYEAALEFKAKWINVEEAIRINKNILKKKEKNPWVNRELFVLNQLNIKL